MNTSAQNVVHIIPGRLELVKNTNGRIPVDLTHKLPDGSRLTDPANRGLLDTILEVIESSEPRLSGPSLNHVIGGLFMLIQWMFLRSIHHFRDLREDHYQAHLLDMANGLDYCIQATRRMREHLETMRSMPRLEREALKLTELFEAANIPRTYHPRLPQVSKLVKEFIRLGDKALDTSPAKSRQRRLNFATLNARTSAIRRLWTARDQLTDPAAVLPYADDVTVQLRRMGAPDKQTPIVPHTVAMKMLLGAMETVMSIGPAFLEWDVSRADETCREGQQEPNGFDRFSNVVRERWGRNLVMHARGAPPPYVVARHVGMTLIPVACQVAVFAHVGRRKVEVETLESNCISGSEEEGRRLSAYIAKRESVESRPCPEYVSRAVELMIAYQGYEAGNPQPLFRQRGKNAMMRVTDYLDKFADMVGARDYVDGDGQRRVWHWRAHEFRRLYAIYYVWRYDDASILALRHHFGHGHEREAAYYARLASDENFTDLMVEVRLFTLEKLRDVANGRVVGTFAEVLAKRIQRVQARMKVTSAKGLESVLKYLVEDEGLTLHAGLWGFCGCKPTPSNLRRAKCMRKNPERERHLIFNTPIPENSEEETCGSCHFHCSESSREPHWRSVVLRLDKAIAGGRPDSMAVQVLKQRREKVNAAAERMFGQA